MRSRTSLSSVPSTASTGLNQISALAHSSCPSSRIYFFHSFSIPISHELSRGSAFNRFEVNLPSGLFANVSAPALPVSNDWPLDRRMMCSSP
jgi:hypothetical protein